MEKCISCDNSYNKNNHFYFYIILRSFKLRRIFIMNKLLLSILGITLSINSVAQVLYTGPKNSNEILHQLKKINSFGTVMYLAAHPDDENTRLISYLVHERNVRTVYYSLTRGDGGQNIIGNEQGKYLGLIRSLEMNEARKLDGAEQIYSSAIDFGFTKNPEEVFTKWDKPQLIKEIKAAIQGYRPDVVILRFPTTGEGGHGQHTASAILALEAYKELQKEAKNNPSIFVPTRILFNAFNFGDRSTQKEDQLKIDINQYNPLLGKSYGQLAGQSRSMHKSQGAGTPQSFGVYKEYFQHLGGIEAQKDILDNTLQTWKELGFPEIEERLNKIIQSFNPQKPEVSIHSLIALVQDLSLNKKYNTNNNQHLINEKIAQLQQAIVDCSQLSIEALANKPSYVIGDTISLNINIAARINGLSITNMRVDYQEINTGNPKLKYDSLYIFATKYQPKKYIVTEPYWLKDNATTKLHNHFPEMVEHMDNASFKTENTTRIRLKITPKYSTLIDVPITYKRLDPLRGDVSNPIRFDQNINLILQQPLVFIEDSISYIPVVIKTQNKENEKIQLQIKQGKNTQSVASITPNNNRWDTIYQIPIAKNQMQQNIISIEAIDEKGLVYNANTEVIKYDHIPETQYKIAAQQKVVKKDWTTTVKNIGYIQGADDWVDDVLKSLSFNVVNLIKSDFNNEAYINDFDAIVVGIRAYNVQEDMTAIQPLLMKYIEQGGTVVVQYNTEKNLLMKDLGPYPFKLSRNRITQEDAPTKILNAQHRLLNYPNKINKEDWDQWIQERGIYYPNSWDEKYETIIQHQEFSESPLKSGILYTSYGKGHYIYTSLAFFRQLPEGNAGAIKLFINLLSASK